MKRSASRVQYPTSFGLRSAFCQIDWEESSVAGRVCVRPHLDEELDNRKHIYNGIDSVLVGSLHQLAWIRGIQLAALVQGRGSSFGHNPS